MRVNFMRPVYNLETKYRVTMLARQEWTRSPRTPPATVFQAEVYAILACAHETEAQDRPEKYVSICSDSQAALKALHAPKMSPLVRQCQQALNDISAQHAMRLFWVPGHAGVRGNETADRLARNGSGHQFIGLESFLGVSRQNIRKKMKRWMKNQHLEFWHGPCSTQRQA
jgi:ribonuclease HI